MLQLEGQLPPTDYNKFVNQGFFTIRRTEKFWSGIWSDMTIEQTEKKDSKSIGGITHGRGITDSVLGKWILAMPTISEVTNKVSEFCHVEFGTSEQHTDGRPSRIERDDEDVAKFLKWFSVHPPFPQSTDIMSISTGLKGSNDINFYL